jgi:TP901 family phage tail tape measure protein
MATAELGINIVARNQARGVLKGLQGDIKGIQQSLGGVMKIAAGNALATGMIAGLNAVTNSLRGVVGGFGEAVQASADFNAQISSIGAVSGASASQLGELKQLASDLGVDPRLKVSAVEAAQAIEMLARNGLKVPDIMAGAAEATVLLANATGADFSTAADVGTDAMALFNIEAKDMITAVDGITSVVNNSKFDINDYRLALSQGGGVAATVGVEFDDFNATLAAIAPLFGSGSDAGTSFKTFLQRLVPQSNEAASAMFELGLMTEDGSNAFFDASGNIKDMAEISGILNRATKSLTEEQKINYLSTIFGSDAMRAAAGIAGNTEAEFRALQETMGQTSATDAASKRMDNLAGDMEIFRGVVESVKIQIGDEFDPALRAVFQSATTLLSDFAPAIVQFASNTGDALDRTIKRIMNVKTQFDFLASGGNVVGGILAALGTATGADVTVPIGAKVVSVDWGGLKASFDNATKDFSITIADYVTGTFNLADYTTTLEIGDFFSGTLNLKDKIAQVSIGDFFAGASIGAGGKITLTFNETDFTFDFMAIKEAIVAQLYLLRSGVSLEVSGLSFSSVVATVAGAISGIPALVSAQLGELTEFATIGTTLQTGLNTLVGPDGALSKGIDFVLSTVADFSTSLATVDVTAATTIMSSVATNVGALITTIGGLQIEAISGGATALSGLAIAITDFSTKIVESINSEAVGATLSTFATGFIDKFTAAISGVGASGMAGAAAALINGISAALRGALSIESTSGIGESVGGLARALMEQITAVFTNESMAANLGEAAVNLSVGLFTAISGALSGLGDSLEGSGGAIGLAGSAATFVGNFIDGVAASLATADFSAVAAAIQGGIKGAFDASLGVVGIDEESSRDRLVQARADKDAAEARAAEIRANAQEQFAQGQITVAQKQSAEIDAAATEFQAISQGRMSVALDVVSSAVRDLFSDITSFKNPFGGGVARGSSDGSGGFGSSVVGLTGDTDIKAQIGPATQAIGEFTQSVLSAKAQIGQIVEGPQTAEEMGFNQEGFTQAQKAVEEFTLSTGQQSEFLQSFQEQSIATSTTQQEAANISAEAQTASAQATMAANAALESLPEPTAAVSSSMTDASASIFGVSESIMSIVGPMGFVASAIIKVAEEIYSAIEQLRGVADAAAAATAAIRGAAAGAAATGAAAGTGASPGSSAAGTNAIGTRNWRGGMTWVGETGPELVSLPRGSGIYSNSDSMAMAGGGGITVNVNIASVASNIDMERFAHKIADIVQRRRR